MYRLEKNALKRRLSGGLLLLLSAGCILSGCALSENGSGDAGRQGSGDGSGDGSDKIRVVTTIFPQYDFVREIAGDQVELQMLLKPGEETHSYEPTPQDIIAIQNSDIFIYVGGENDAWVEDILDSMPDTETLTLRLTDCVETVEEELTEGMKGASGHSHDHDLDGDEDGHDSEDDGEDDDDADEGSNQNDDPEGETVESVHEIDEHVWTSPVNASAIVEEIAELLGAEDPEHKALYEANASAYQEELTELDREFREITGAARSNLLIFGDRFPFRYFADEYGLEYYAAFPGCASDTEPSAATIAFLIDKVKEEQVPAVLKMELSSDNIASAIGEAAGVEVRTFYSCHNLSAEEFEAGESYISMMRKNARTLKEVLKVGSDKM